MPQGNHLIFSFPESLSEQMHDGRQISKVDTWKRSLRLDNTGAWVAEVFPL